MKTVVVCGGRRFADRQFVYDSLSGLHAEHEFGLIAHGGATGVDSFADEWARNEGLHVLTHWLGVDAEHDQDAHGRYDELYALLKPAFVVAFTGEDGTRRMVDGARRAGIPVIRPSARSDAT